MSCKCLTQLGARCKNPVVKNGFCRLHGECKKKSPPSMKSRPRCGCRTDDGTACKNLALEGSTRCAVHRKKCNRKLGVSKPTVAKPATRPVAGRVDRVPSQKTIQKFLTENPSPPRPKIAKPKPVKREDKMPSERTIQKFLREHPSPKRVVKRSDVGDKVSTFEIGESSLYLNLDFDDGNDLQKVVFKIKRGQSQLTIVATFDEKRYPIFAFEDSPKKVDVKTMYGWFGGLQTDISVGFTAEEKASYAKTLSMIRKGSWLNMNYPDFSLDFFKYIKSLVPDKFEGKFIPITTSVGGGVYEYDL